MKKNMTTLNYNLSDTESLLFETERDGFDLYSFYEGAAQKTKLAIYRGGKWIFEDYHQRKLFWFLFNIYKKEFGKAFKLYIRSLNEKPKTYVFTCAKRRLDIKITKMKKNMNEWFYDTFYGR